MNIEDFLKKFNEDIKFKEDLLKHVEKIQKKRYAIDLKEHQKNLSSLEDNLLLALIGNSISPTKKGIKLK
jgi:hypothetical protein